MLTAMLGFRHAATNRLENLSSAQFRNQETERVPVRGGIGTDVTAGTNTAFDHSGQLQFAQGTIYRGPGSSKLLHEFGLARKALPRLILSRRDRVRKILSDSPVFRRFLLAHGADNTDQSHSGQCRPGIFSFTPQITAD